MHIKGDFERIVLLNPLDKKYECPVCHDILRYPVQFEDCGHRVCSSCLVDLLKWVTETVQSKSELNQYILMVHSYAQALITSDFNILKFITSGKKRCKQWWSALKCRAKLFDHLFFIFCLESDRTTQEKINCT